LLFLKSKEDLQLRFDCFLKDDLDMDGRIRVNLTWIFGFVLLFSIQWWQQVEERSFYRELDNNKTLLGVYDRDSYMDGDEGEITWFNAGVRVGVGLGLGMCVGLGIGVGLMMRAYQSTTRTLKRRFL
jgi:hypothetical protein